MMQSILRTNKAVYCNWTIRRVVFQKGLSALSDMADCVVQRIFITKMSGTMTVGVFLRGNNQSLPGKNETPAEQWSSVPR
jgi:hypothetical protein